MLGPNPKKMEVMIGDGWSYYVEQASQSNWSHAEAIVLGASFENLREQIN